MIEPASELKVRCSLSTRSQSACRVTHQKPMPALVDWYHQTGALARRCRHTLCWSPERNASGPTRSTVDRSTGSLSGPLIRTTSGPYGALARNQPGQRGHGTCLEELGGG